MRCDGAQLSMVAPSWSAAVSVLRGSRATIGRSQSAINAPRDAFGVPSESFRRSRSPPHFLVPEMQHVLLERQRKYVNSRSYLADLARVET